MLSRCRGDGARPLSRIQVTGPPWIRLARAPASTDSEDLFCPLRRTPGFAVFDRVGQMANRANREEPISQNGAELRGTQ